ncbi:hypothetical protein J5N97_007989 [Dioscorea zingiberensis]|uniref:Uncharacterized protein n=1 Tax=Dioscorea zingiberensis TaxID=325984 RepID=A0A9D5DET8_9LILI|nr:hypothetical protein J5N97_007989 [Dioscorea zingiberensis]
MGPLSLSQAPATPAAPPPSPNCNGIELSYNLDSRELIHSHVSDPKAQSYAFRATATILNSGDHDLKSWAYPISFQHRELIIYASPAVLLDDSPFPYTTPQDSPTSFSGFPNTDLKTPIEITTISPDPYQRSLSSLAPSTSSLRSRSQFQLHHIHLILLPLRSHRR